MEITHIVLSDLHLGEEDSVLTPLVSESMSESGEFYEYWKPLGDFLEYLLKKNKSMASLVLLGDVIDFALADPIASPHLFFEFIRFLCRRRALFSQVIYIPGNHDHRIWELAKQIQYNSFVNRTGKSALNKEPWNKTRALITKDYHYVSPIFWETLINEGFDIKILYPNFFIRDDISGHITAFHHGHFLEPIYILLSRLKRIVFGVSIPDDIDAIEQENGPWIEFLFSSFGYTGELGKRVETFYEAFQSKHTLERIMAGMAGNLLEELGLRPNVRRILIYPFGMLLRYVTRFAYGGIERSISSETLSQGLAKGIEWYIMSPLRKQILEDLDASHMPLIEPKEINFVFGHTHKPFFKSLVLAGVKVDLFNLGSFIVDSFHLDTVYGTGIGFVTRECGTGLFILKDKTSNMIFGNQALQGQMGPVLEEVATREFLVWLVKERHRRAMAMKKRVLQVGGV